MWIRDDRIDGTTYAPNLTVRATSPSRYAAGKVTPASFQLCGLGTSSLVVAGGS
jgi:hypothetical protein